MSGSYPDDHIIVKVQRDSYGNISRVQLRSGGYKDKHEVVVDIIRNGASYAVMRAGKVTPVHPVGRYDVGYFLRTDRNNTRIDNLGELPEF